MPRDPAQLTAPRMCTRCRFEMMPIEGNIVDMEILRGGLEHPPPQGSITFVQYCGNPGCDADNEYTSCCVVTDLEGVFRGKLKKEVLAEHVPATYYFVAHRLPQVQSIVQNACMQGGDRCEACLDGGKGREDCDRYQKVYRVVLEEWPVLIAEIHEAYGIEHDPSSPAINPLPTGKEKKNPLVMAWPTTVTPIEGPDPEDSEDELELEAEEEELEDDFEELGPMSINGVLLGEAQHAPVWETDSQ